MTIGNEARTRWAGLIRRPPTGIAGAAFWLAVWFLLLWVLRLIPGGIGTFFGVLQIFVGIALVAVAVPLGLRTIRQRMLWSLRNKLVLTYLLIGLAPVLLFVTLVTIAAYVAAGQFAIHLAESREQAELEQLSTDNGHRVGPTAAYVSEQLPRQRPGTVLGRPEHEKLYPSAAEAVRLARESMVFLDGAPLPIEDMTARGKTPLGLPPWAADLPGGKFKGMVVDEGDLYLVAIDQLRLPDGRRFSLLSSILVNSPFMETIAQGLGRARMIPLNAPESSASPEKSDSGGDIAAQPAEPSSSRVRRSLRSRTGAQAVTGGVEAEPVNMADLRVRFLSTLPIVDWESGKTDYVPIEMDSRPSLLYRQLFGGSLSGIVTSVIRFVLAMLCIVFALIELLAFVMAMRLSRTVTTSIEDLYQATQHIDSGDLTYRIGVQREDQLAELSRSFNRMTQSLQRLLEEQKEKERLQNEISIAQEVQANLFPHQACDLPTLKLHGVCRPARSVSGDYYDFLVFHEEAHDGQASRRETGVGIALGDISGKGISAALLMATLHSAVRAYRFASEELVFSESQLEGLMADREERGRGCDELFQSPGRILSLLNRHLFRSTQPEKYATLFLAHYDAGTGLLTYSNAGQLPPLVLSRDGSVRRLDKGGTVVGLMDGMQYEEDRFGMREGDILVAYSDGVTEPENDFGEFGEERLMEVVSRYRDQPLHVISAQVMQALDAWIGAEEQPDDITLVLARQL